MKSLENKLKNATEKLDEAQTFMYATKEYVKMSRKVIANLRRRLAFLEVDVKTAEEALLESERVMSCLKDEVNSCFQSICCHYSNQSHKIANHDVKENTRCFSENDKFTRNVSVEALQQSLPHTSIVENERKNSEKNMKRVHSKTPSELSESDPVHRTSISASKNGGCLVPNSNLQNCSNEEVNSNAETIKLSYESDSLFRLKSNLNEISSDSLSYETYNERSESELNFLDRKKYNLELIQRALKRKYDIDVLSLRKTQRNCNRHRLYMQSTKSWDDSSTTDEESYENVLCSSFNQKGSIKDNYRYKKANLSCSNSCKYFQKRLKSFSTDNCRESRFGRTVTNPLIKASSDKYLYKNSSSGKEFSESSVVRDFLPQNKNFNDFDQPLQNGYSKESAKVSGISYCDIRTSKDNVVSSNKYLSLGNFQNLNENLPSFTKRADSFLCSNWSGETLIINSTRPCFKDILAEVIHYENLDKSDKSSITENEEMSNYVTFNSQSSSNESTYFSFMRERNADNSAEGNSFRFLSNTSLKEPATSIYDNSLNPKQCNKSSVSSCRSLDVTLWKVISEISSTEISSNESICENSNSPKSCAESNKSIVVSCENFDVTTLEIISDMSFTEISSNESICENSNSPKSCAESNKSIVVSCENFDVTTLEIISDMSFTEISSNESICENSNSPKFRAESNKSIVASCENLDVTTWEIISDMSFTEISSNSSEFHSDSNKSSIASCESFDASMWNVVSDMSLTEISSNESINKNLNSNEFHSNSSQNENSNLRTYSSSFSVSKQFTNIPEANHSYASLRERLQPVLSDTSLKEKSVYGEQLEANSSCAFEDKALTVETHEMAVKDVAPEYPLYDFITSEQNEINEDKSISNGTSEPLGNGLKKSGTSILLENSLACEIGKNVLVSEGENTESQETDNTNHVGEIAKSCATKKNLKRIFSKNIRSFIKDNHWFM